MPRSLTSVTTAKVKIADRQVVKFSKAVLDAMLLADRYEHIKADEYVVPIANSETRLPEYDNYPFEKIAYSRL